MLLGEPPGFNRVHDVQEKKYIIFTHEVMYTTVVHNAITSEQLINSLQKVTYEGG